MGGATYLKLTATSKNYLEKLPPVDPNATFTAEAFRSAGGMPLSKAKFHHPDVDREEMSIFAGGKMVKLSIYRPPGSHNETLPALIYIHGGGWVCSPKQTYEFICSKIAAEAGCAVFFVHYSLSPEDRFPTAVEECYATYAWLTNPANVFLNVDPTRVAVAGDSSGGNLAIALCLLANERECEHKPKFQALFYPVTNDQFNTASYFEFGKDFRLTRAMMEWFWEQYVPGGKDSEDRKNPLAAPLKATNDQLKNLPSTFLVTAEADVIREEGEEFGRKLLEAGVKASCMRVMGVLHGFMSTTDLFDEDALNVLDMTIGNLRRALDPAPRLYQEPTEEDKKLMETIAHTMGSTKKGGCCGGH